MRAAAQAVMTSIGFVISLEGGSTDTRTRKCESDEKVAFVVVVREPWTMENGMLTPTMKIKRNVIEDFYNQKMDDWFSQKKKVVWEF